MIVCTIGEAKHLEFGNKPLHWNNYFACLFCERHNYVLIYSIGDDFIVLKRLAENIKYT